MAFTNPNKPAGLSPVQNLLTTGFNAMVNIYEIAAADTNAYYPGDLVKLTGTGDANGVPGVTLAAAGNQVVGVIVAAGGGGGAFSNGGGVGGPYINPNNLSQVYRPGAAQSNPWYVAVADDPNQIFEIQEGGANTNLTQANIGEYASIIYAAPATGVYVSGTMLNNATASATATGLQLKLLRLAQRIDNHFVTTPATGGGYQKWWVRIIQHSYNTLAVSGV